MSSPKNAPHVGPAGRLLYGGGLAACVAGLVHLGVVLVGAQRLGDTAYDRVATAGHGVRLQTFGGSPAGGPAVPFRDPAMVDAFCLFDLRSGPVEVSLPVTPLDVALLSIHDRHGRAISVLTNRSAIHGALTLSIMSAATAAGAEADEADEGTLRVPYDGGEGFVMAQVLAATPSETAAARAMASRLECRARPTG